jgi:serine/threonine-protein kinase RsbW
MLVQEQQLTIPAIIEKIEDACQFVSRIARSAGMEDEAVYRCYLSVEEICTNIIEHGYHYREDNNVIDVVCRWYPDRLAITIIDDAAPFNPLENADPDPSASLLERRGGGWGIYFVKRYMDKIDYTRQGNRNQLTIEKHF